MNLTIEAIRAMTAVIPGQRRNQYNLLSQARRQPGPAIRKPARTSRVFR